MTFRATALTGAALAAILMVGAPASAQRSPYTTNPTPEERAQTNQLNTGAANQADYNAARDDYNAKLNAYDAQRAAYDRDRSRYLRDRFGYARRWRVFYGYTRFQDLSRFSESRLIGLQVSTRGGGFVGRVRDVDTNSYGRVIRIAVATSRDRVAWVDADDLRYDPAARIIMTDLSRGQIDDMARMRYPRF